MSQFKDEKMKFLFCPLIFGSFSGFAHFSSFRKEQHVTENEYEAWHDTDGRKPKAVLGKKCVPLPLFEPPISQGLIQDRNWAFSVRGQR